MKQTVRALKTIGVLILLSTSSIFGQEPPHAVTMVGEKLITRAITVKYPGRVDTNVLNGIGLNIKSSGNIIVMTGALDRVDTAEAIIKQMDVPAPPPAPVEARKNIQLTAYMVIASPAMVDGTPVPKDLDPAISQVSSIFPYKSFNLFDAVVVRMVEGSSSGNVAGALPLGRQTFALGGSYDLGIRSIGLTSAAPANLLRLNAFSLHLLVNGGPDRDGKEKVQRVNIDTNIDMKEGQKIVVGKANIDGSENALIVILTAKVVD